MFSLFKPLSSPESARVTYSEMSLILEVPVTTQTPLQAVADVIKRNTAEKQFTHPWLLNLILIFLMALVI